jgi:hypothetical protein
VVTRMVGCTGLSVVVTGFMYFCESEIVYSEIELLGNELILPTLQCLH